LRSATATITARSIYRGYSYEGLGEGPGRPIARGEQFLEADPPFRQDADALSALRPWMTLDLDAGDHRRLGDRLEAWSSFSYADWAVVVRLAPSGTFDRRAAYFSHGRAFAKAAVSGAADPGALLGRSEAFDTHWPGGGGEAAAAVPAPEMVRPDQVAAEKETAAALLAHLLQGLLSGRPTVMAVPVDELVTGAPLHALVSFARAALPPLLKQRCRIRVYARSPELFLGRMECHLLVVPDAVASDALSVRRDAVLLDRRCQRHAGSEPDPQVRAWARKVTLWACERPWALLGFAARYGEQIWDGCDGPPGGHEVASVSVAYRIAEELAEDEAPSRNFFGQLKNAAGKLEPGAIPWRQLLAAGDWDRFPRREILELVFAGAEGLPEGVRDLQAAATQTAEELGWSVDELLDNGWVPADDCALKRLLDLASKAPGLVPGETLGHCLADVPLRRLMELGRLAQVLETEDGVELLARRAEELGDLPALLVDETARPLILRAVLERRLAPSILESMMQTAERQGNGRRWLSNWLETVDTDPLLSLAASLSGGGGVLERGVADVLLDRMEQEPAEVTARLIRRGAWSWWRRLASERVSRTTAWALAWLGSPVWDEPPRVDPRLEDWELVMTDLGDRQQIRGLIERLETGRRPWPWIPLFVDRQLEDLARRMPDLGALATLVDRCHEDEILPRRNTEEWAFSAFSAERPSLRGLDSTALRWLGEAPDARDLPDLSASAGDLLYRQAGPRRDRLVDNLAGWLESNGLTQGAQGDLLPWLDRLGEQRRSEATDRGRAMARKLADRGHRGAAELLDPQIDVGLARRDDIRRLLDNLTHGRPDDPFWRELYRRLVAFRQGDTSEPRHPIRALTQELSGEPTPDCSLPDTVWPSFSTLMDRYPGLFAATDDAGEAPLPAFELAALLFEGLPAGSLAVRFAFSAPRELAESDGWWRSLLRGVDDCRRRQGRRSTLDRPDITRALLSKVRHDLSEQGRTACGRALWLEPDSEKGPSAPGALSQAHPGGAAWPST